MAEFGWAYINCGNVLSGAGGPEGAVQYKTSTGIDGQAGFIYDTGSNRVAIGVDWPDLDGTTIPNATLHVNGDVSVTGTIYATAYQIENITSLSASGDSKFGNSADDIHEFTGSVKINGTFTTDGNVTLGDAAGDVATVTGKLTASNGAYVAGNVGLGTSTPGGPLHIYKAAADQDHTPMELLRLEQQDEGVDMAAGHGPAITFYVGETGGSDHGGSVAVVREEQGDADSAAAMSFYTAGDDSAPTEKMRITSVGLVGIGTTSPDETLHVAGNLKVDGYILGGSPVELTGALSITGSDGTGFTVTGSGSPAEGGEMETRVSGTMFVTGSLTVTGSSSLTVDGPTYLYGDVTLGSDADHTITLAAPMTASGGIVVTGSAKFADEVEFAGSFTAVGIVTASNGLEVTNHVHHNNGVSNFNGTRVTLNSDVTASNGILIADDTLLRFGTAAGDATFEYDEDGTDTLLYAGASLRISDDVKLEFGTGGDASIEYDENGTDELRFAGAAVTFEQVVTFDANVTLGDAASDVTTVTGKLTGSNGAEFAGDVLPATDITYDLGAPAKRWKNIYTGDLHLKNERGDWTIVEESDYLGIRNNNTGKLYKFVLEEVEEE